MVVFGFRILKCFCHYQRGAARAGHSVLPGKGPRQAQRAILKKRHFGSSGGSGRNTAIMRANQRTQENIRLYD